MSWDPAQYLKFAGERMRPAVDLLARVAAEAPQAVVDLGCGAGNLAPLLMARWPGAQLTGVDSSPEMLARARAAYPKAQFVQGDIGAWRPARPVDVLYSNAALHWLDGHERLLPALLESLAPGGWLAVQMPRNFSAPSHTSIVETIEQGSWRARLEPLVRREPVAAPGFYWRLLEPRAAELQVWETEYLQVLEGEDPVLEWVKATGLRPVLNGLEGAERERFLQIYRQRLRQAYPQKADGKTLYPFPRLFIVATV